MTFSITDISYLGLESETIGKVLWLLLNLLQVNNVHPFFGT